MYSSTYNFFKLSSKQALKNLVKKGCLLFLNYHQKNEWKMEQKDFSKVQHLQILKQTEDGVVPSIAFHYGKAIIILSLVSTFT